MSSKELTAVFIAGLVSSGLFLIIFGVGLGFLFMLLPVLPFLPSIPLFSLGLGRQPYMALAAASVGAVIVAAAASPAIAVFFLVFLGLPAWYICKESLRARTGADGATEWFPIGLVLLQLTLYACGAVALVCLYYDATLPGGIAGLLAQDIREAFTDIQDEYGDIIETLATRWSFLIFSTTVWLWGLALYAHAWLANRALARKGIALRPDFSVQSFAMPDWMLALLAICALASLIGSPAVSFLGKTTLISLLLPYFLLGASLMHAASRNWPSRRVFLFFIYFLMFAQFWLAILLSGVGLWHHIKRLSAGGTSSKH